MEKYCNSVRTSEEVFGKLPVLDIVGKKGLLLTHTDLDGEGAHLILDWGMNESPSVRPNLEVRRLSNGEMSQGIEYVLTSGEYRNYDFIIACDISCKESECETIMNHEDRDDFLKKFIILDHHVSADYLNNYPFAICQSACISDSELTDYARKEPSLEGLEDDILNEKLMSTHSSGTSLMYDYLQYLKRKGSKLITYPKRVYRYLAFIIKSYDTWDWVNIYDEKDNYKNLETLFSAYGAEGFFQRYSYCSDNKRMISYFNYWGKPSVAYTEMEEFILMCEKQKQARYIEAMEKRIKTGQLKVGDDKMSVVYVSSDKYTREVTKRLQELYPDAEIYMLNYGTGISLRTNKDIELYPIAEEYGGGGHGQAAGLKIPHTYMDDIVFNQVFKGNLELD